LDFATLTGAARTALGPDVPPFFATDETLAAELAKSSQDTADPIWRLPLWDAYDGDMDSPIADLKNTGDAAFAGSIYGALFLRRFVDAPAWAHFDIYAWAPKERPARPAGGEAQALRASSRNGSRLDHLQPDLVNRSDLPTTSCGFALASTTKSANGRQIVSRRESMMELIRDQIEALNLWRRVTVTTVRSDAPDLTARQLAVLMTVRLQPAPHTVRGLAAALNVGKPAITRALDTLTRLGFVQRRRDPKDGRNVFVDRTERGDAFLEQLGRTIVSGEARPMLELAS